TPSTSCGSRPARLPRTYRPPNQRVRTRPPSRSAARVAKRGRKVSARSGGRKSLSKRRALAGTKIDLTAPLANGAPQPLGPHSSHKVHPIVFHAHEVAWRVHLLRTQTYRDAVEPFWQLRPAVRAENPTPAALAFLFCWHLIAAIASLLAAYQ